MNKERFFVFSVAFLIAVIGGIAIFYSTELGPWTMVDTMDYFDVAGNFSHGRGLVVTRPSGFGTPMTIHPPFYSIVLSLGLMLNIRLLEYARILDILLFTVLILVLVLGTYRQTSSPSLSIGLGLWALTDHAIFRNYTAALSEPLFLTLGFASIYLILEFVITNRSSLLVTASLAAGLSLATRYSGAAFLVAGFATILMWDRTTGAKKIRNLTAYALISSAPILIWMVYLRISFPGSSPGGYQFVDNVWEVMTPFRLTYIGEFWSWFGFRLISSTEDYRVQISVIALVLFILGLAAFLSIRISLREEKIRDASALVIPGSAWFVFALASTAILLFSYIFVYAPKPWLDERLYSPLQMGTVITLLFVIHFCASKLIIRPYQGLPVLAAIALIITANIPRTIHTLNKLHDVGEGYTRRSWGDTMLFDALQNIPSDKMIFTNDPGAIFFFLDRTSVDLIPIIEYTDTHEVPAIFQEEGVYIVLFERRLSSQIHERYGEETDEYIQKLTANLHVQYKGNIGTIYYVK